MPTAIVTGASRGLGLALTRALDERGWRLVVDARDADALDAAVDAPHGVVAIAGDVADAGHRDALVAAAGDRDRPARQQRERARPEPAAAARDLSARRAAARVRGQRLRAAGARAARAAAPCTGRRDPQRHLRRGRRGLRGLGRLRLVEGRAGAADRDPRRRASRAARLRGRPRRHADADAPGRVPRRGHLGPAAAGGERPGTARPDRGSLPSGRYSAPSSRAAA